MSASPCLRFVWWNVESFAHFDPKRVVRDRWPESAEAFQEKLRRVETVLKSLSAEGTPHLIALAESTREASEELRRRLCPSYRLHELSALYPEPDFHLAVLYDPTVGFEAEDFLTVDNVPDSTRPMAILDLIQGDDHLRFYMCHWTSRIGEASETARQLAGRALSSNIYEFLRADLPPGGRRHAVVLGDLNEEPYGLVETWLFASRNRAPSRRPEHHADAAVKRVRLYNCSWRLLGEHHAHPPPDGEREMAGTLYWREERSWHTFDQVIVSGSLLGSQPPFLQESRLRIAATANVMLSEFLGRDGLPQKFAWNNGEPLGLSDHLPVTGMVVLR